MDQRHAAHQADNYRYPYIRRDADGQELVEEYRDDYRYPYIRRDADGVQTPFKAKKPAELVVLTLRCRWIRDELKPGLNLLLQLHVRLTTLVGPQRRMPRC